MSSAFESYRSRAGEHSAVIRFVSLLTGFSLCILAQGPENVLVVVNQKSAISRQIGTYYVQKRSIPASNICSIDTAESEKIERGAFDKEIQAAIGECLRSRNLVEKIFYIVTTRGVPLWIMGKLAPDGDLGSVDSELTLLYSVMKGKIHRLNGPVPNPFYEKIDIPFVHPRYPIYLVTRLTGYDFKDVKAIIDKALMARNTGKFVIDLKGGRNNDGNEWLRSTALMLPLDRVIIDETDEVLRNQHDVIGYASWGSNDKARKERTLGFQWLPGAIMTEFVSENGRTFERPPKDWNISNHQADRKLWFAGSPQTLTADYIAEGATGASGHVNEPYLRFCPRPDYVLPAYYSGRNLAESFYIGIPALSWMNIVVGDPLCNLGKPPKR